MCMTDRRLQGLGVQIKAFSKNVNTSNLYLITVVYFLFFINIVNHIEQAQKLVQVDALEILCNIL